MKGIKAFVLSFVVLAGVSAYAATRSRCQARVQESSCCISSCCEVGAACCPVQSG